MQIVVNHLTRMQKGCICVAGIDLKSGRHIRPMLRSQMRTDLLVRGGGLFDIGCVVDLGPTKYIGEPPATEDFLFEPDKAKRCEDMDSGEFWHWLTISAQPKLRLIFGEDLVPCGQRSYGVEKRKGQASLGCYIAPNRPHLFIQRRDEFSRGRIRLEFTSGQYKFELAVTDIRLFSPDHVTPEPAIVEHTNDRLQAASRVLLSVGLTRPFKLPPGRPALHWLQVNNLHFEDYPCWKLG